MSSELVTNTVGAALVGIALLWKYTNSGHTADAEPVAQLLPLTKSSIDGLSYRVMQTPNAVDAANQLCRLRQAVQRVLTELRQLTGAHPANVAAGVERLLKRHPNAHTVNLIELHPKDAKHTIAYNEGKSTHIFLCMRQNPPSDQLGSDDVLLYIVLHELAHTMVEGYAPSNENGQTVHDENFRTHNEYLNNVAERLGLLRPGQVPGTAHCGVVMPSPEESA